MKQGFLISLIILRCAASASAETTNRISIEELRQVRLPEVVLESVTQNRPNAAAYIEVKGVIGEHIRFELLLPEAWNGPNPHVRMRGAPSD